MGDNGSYPKHCGVLASCCHLAKKPWTFLNCCYYRAILKKSAESSLPSVSSHINWFIIYKMFTRSLGLHKINNIFIRYSGYRKYWYDLCFPQVLRFIFIMWNFCIYESMIWNLTHMEVIDQCVNVIINTMIFFYFS